jgi:hypothetical protein
MNGENGSIQNPELNERVLQARLRYSQASLASSKYVFTSLAAASFAISFLARDHFFTVTGLILALLAALFATVQSGLLSQRRWARRIAIGFSCLQLPSLAFPLALLSLRGLLSREVAVLFRSGQAARQTVSAWRAHRFVLVVAATVFATLVTTGLARRELRERQVLSRAQVVQKIPHAASSAERGK